MNIEKSSTEIPKTPGVGDPGESSVQRMSERGGELYGKAESAVGDAYEKTERVVGEKYRQAMNYGGKNPGKSLLVTLLIGMGLGYLLGACTRETRTSQFQKYFR
ncbi:hypothetical protein [Desulfonatronum parangueonense]